MNTEPPTSATSLAEAPSSSSTGEAFTQKRQREDNPSENEGDSLQAESTSIPEVKRAKMEDSGTAQLPISTEDEMGDRSSRGEDATQGKTQDSASTHKQEPQDSTGMDAEDAHSEKPEVARKFKQLDPPSDPYGTRIQNDRWIVHQITEDYVDFVGRMMYPGTQFKPYGFDVQNRAYPLEGISALGFLKSPLRRPTIAERWSPYEVALFEAALLHHGKEFHKVSREVGTKNTREVIDFYYVWKKTAHYKKWKDAFVSDDELIEFETTKVPGRRS
eukprot:Nitzschia sp. Nitz4//scaffold1_size375055//310690//311598//NITZ4_000325-RA/size375055-processed-gene-0.463-mRNA-1//-1//CDS//3329541192//3600//frame0